MMAVLATVFVWVGTGAAILTPIVYGLGNRWWANYWGRTLMFKDIMLALVYARSAVTLIANHGVVQATNATTVAITVGLGLALAANLAVMIRVTRRARTAPSRRADVVFDGEKDNAP